MKVIVRIFAIIVLMAVAFFDMYSQTELDIRWKSVYGSQFSIFFEARCNNMRTYALDRSNVSIIDNGEAVQDFILFCPDTTKPCPMSVALVLDESGSMGYGSPTGMDYLKAATHAFIDAMDGSTDQAAVIGFNSSLTIQTGITTSKAVLNNAVDQLNANGGTALWNGVYAGLSEIAAHGTNRCKAIVLVTDGDDNSSTHSEAECVQLADSLMIPMFIIGLGSGVNAALLDAAALNTGGKFYILPDPAQLTATLQQIYAAIRNASNGLCRIDFSHPVCLDGSNHTISVTLLNVCGGGDVKTFSYKPKRDSTTFVPFHVQLPRVSMNLFSQIVVPVSTIDTLTALKIDTTSWKISYDDAHLHFDSAYASAGALLDGVPLKYELTPGNVIIRTNAATSITTGQLPATLFSLAFTADSSFSADSLCTPLGLGSGSILRGCIAPYYSGGRICIMNPNHGQNPNFACVHIDAPDSLQWNSAMKDYALNPFRVKCTIKNTEMSVQKNVSFKIIFSDIDFELVSPPQDRQPGTPVEIAVNDSTSAEWLIHAKRHASSFNVRICFEAGCGTLTPITCCRQIWIAHADLPAVTFECKVDTPAIVYNALLDEYSPMPFSVKVQLWNSGSIQIDSLAVRILPPPEIILAGNDAPDKFMKYPTPVTLNPGQTGTASWTLWTNRSSVQKILPIGMHIMTRAGDTSYCASQVIVPAMPAPRIEAQCVTPSELQYDSTSGLFRPDPFDVVVSCRNIGTRAASNIRARLVLPPEASLFNPNDSLTKTFSPALMQPFSAGDTAQQLSWKVRITGPQQSTSIARIRFIVSGTDAVRLIPLDTVTQECDLVLPGVGTSYACANDATGNPDSLSRTSDGADLTPNPFTWTASIANSGTFASSIVKAEIGFASSGMTLDSLTPAIRFPNKLVKPGKNFQIGWLIHADVQRQPRVETIRVQFTDDRGTSSTCSTDLPIPGVSALIACNLAASVKTLVYDPVLRRYQPDAWTISDTLVNAGKLPLTNLRASIQWNNGGSVPLASLDPAFPDNANPKTIAVLPVKASAQFTWGFQLIADNNGSGAERVKFSVTYKADEQDVIPSGCSGWVDVGPKSATGLGSPAMPEAFLLYQNYPNPFHTKTTIRYSLATREFVTLTIHDLLGCEVERLVGSNQSAGQYVLPFDAGHLPEGLYECRLRVGAQIKTMKMLMIQ